MDFPLPPVGEGLYEVELVRWLVRPGDAVARGQGLMEVMSDKATMEVPAPFAGTVTGLSASPGAKVQVGQVVLTYNPAGEPNGELASADRASGAGADLRDREAAERGRRGNSEVAGTVVSRVSTGDLTGTRRAEHGGGELVAARQDSANGPAATTVGSPAKLPAAAPSVRMLARKLGIDLAAVRGSGPHGRILLDDLTPFLHPRPAAPAEKSRTADALKLDFGTAGTTVKLLGLRRKIAEHMVAAKQHIPHYSYIDECDLTDLVRLRGQLRDPFAKAGVKLTYLAFFVKAAVRALKEIPIVNSTFDEAASEIRLLDRYHIGVAVATPGGLIVPVVKDADKKDLAAIAAEIERLSADARVGHSRLDDLKGSTFTVTSVGGIGGLISTPIINHPEVGIMGVGKVVKRPVYDAAGEIRPADVIYLSFSFDHRIVDGAVGASFANAVIRQLQNPALLLLPEKFGG
ncbi:MAG TPA: dihydrolipoamide acetyltransferase family protein [Gemmataceae bacterium]|nr:dihydrolipoamide acetyltransferase family protein [Gemmataceae bacterium]